MKPVIVSTIGPKNVHLESGLSHDQIIDAEVAFWRAKIDAVLPDRPDLIVLPEVCDRPANTDIGDASPAEARLAYYRARGNRILEALAAIARERRCYITYPAIHRDEADRWTNRVTLLGRDGQVAGAYDKNFLVREENTHAGCAFGDRPSLIECDFGRVGCLICFDLNFVELAEHYAKQRPDLLLFCSRYHGGFMQRYWAYACRCHLVSSVMDLPSAMINPSGTVVAETTNYTDHVTARLNLDARLAHLDYHFDKLDQLKARYGRDVTITDPGYLGSVLVTSEHEEHSAEQMLDALGIRELTAYFDSARSHRAEHQPINDLCASHFMPVRVGSSSACIGVCRPPDTLN